jgi:hypothetical protein
MLTIPLGIPFAANQTLLEAVLSCEAQSKAD